jgi:hypothetical protein
MEDSIYISIPCSYEDRILTVKGLKLSAKGDSPDQALLECIKNTPLYMPMMLAKFVSFTDFRKRTFMQIEVPFHATILKKINEVEPYPESTRIKSKSVLVEPSHEEKLKFGF